MDRHVVVTGWGQFTQPQKIQGKAHDPLGLMVQASLKAIQKLGHTNGPSPVDGIMVVRPLSAHYSDPGQAIGNKLGISPKLTHVVESDLNRIKLSTL